MTMEGPIKDMEEDDKTTKFKVIEGGKPAPAGKEPPGRGRMFLKDLSPGDKFLVMDNFNPNEYVQQEFELITKEFGDDGQMVGALLHTDTNNSLFVWVNPTTFCRKFGLVKVLEKMKEELGEIRYE